MLQEKKDLMKAVVKEKKETGRRRLWGCWRNLGIVQKVRNKENLVDFQNKRLFAASLSGSVERKTKIGEMSARKER